MTALLLMTVLLFQQQPAVQPGGSISGHLLFSDRTPAARTRISLVLPPSDPNRIHIVEEVFTDETGAFRFEGVAPGSYSLADVRSRLYYPGVSVIQTARSITIEGNSVVAGLEFVLPPGGVRVSGRVSVTEDINLAAMPEDARKLDAFGGRPFRSESTVIAPDGSFELRRMMPGDYSLTVPSLQPMKALEITVGDRDVTGLQLKMPQLVRVLGTVAFEGRAVSAAITVKFNGSETREWDSWSQTQSRPDRTFQIGLLEGEYRAVVRDLPAGYYLKSLTAGPTNLLTQPLKADLANPAVRIVATLAPSSGVKVRGRVKGSTDALPEYASRQITLTAAASRTTVSGAVNADGSFELDKVMPGTHVARVSLDETLSSSPAVVVIPEKDTKDLDISVPGLVEVFGRVAVDGNGPAPKFSLALVRGAGLNESPLIARDALRGLAESGAAQVIELHIDPLSDGTFRMMLPEGPYRLVPDTELPVPFFFRSINYGSARLMTEPMIVSASDPAQLFVGFGTSGVNPWAKVSGRVVGLNASLGSYRVAFEEYQLARQEVPVNVDGTFEFPMALLGYRYEVSLVPRNDAATVARIPAVKGDVKDVQIVVPGEREVTVRVTVAERGAVPGFLLQLEKTPCRPDCTSLMDVVVKPERDGSARVKLPDDERKVYVQGLPAGYSVDSLTYGATNLEVQPLKLAGSETRDLEVKLSIDPQLPTGSIRGRITGLDAESRPDQIILHGVAFISSFEAPVSADGSFVFSKLPQGTYAPTLTGDVPPGRLTPSSVVVTGKDLTGIDIAVPRRSSSARSERPAAETRPTGVTMTELGRFSTEAGSASSAVANLRTINTAQVTYLGSSGGNYGSLQDLVDAGLLDESFMKVKAGYAFSIVANGPEYAAVAIPSGGSTPFAYYSLPDAVVRYSLTEGFSPPRQSGHAVR
jgi:hypothetical protein